MNTQLSGMIVGVILNLITKKYIHAPIIHPISKENKGCSNSTNSLYKRWKSVSFVLLHKFVKFTQ